MLDLGFLPDIEKILAQAAGAAPDDAVLGHHAGPDRRAGPPLPAPSPTHIRAESPRRDARRCRHIDQFVYRAHALDKAEVLARVLQADGRGLTMIFTRTKRTAAEVADDLDRARLRRRRRPRRPRPGRPRAGAARVPHRQGRRPGRHRRRRPRHRRRGRHPRHQLPVPRRREDLPAPHRPHRPRRRGRHRDHPRRLGRRHRWKLINKALDLPFPEPAETYSTSDAPLRRARHPARRPPAAAARRSAPAPGLDAEEIEDLGETGRKQPSRSPAAAAKSRLVRPPDRGRSSHRDPGSRPARRTAPSRPAPESRGPRASASAPAVASPPPRPAAGRESTAEGHQRLGARTAATGG